MQLNAFKKWGTALCFVTAVAFGIGLSGCSKGGGNGGSGGSGGSSGGYDPKKPVAVGMVVGKTGPLENWGKQSENGALLALEELKGKDGITLDLIVEDNASKPDQAANAFVNLATVKNVAMVTGCVASSCTLKMKPQAKKLRVPMVSHASTNVTVPEGTDLVSRICYADDFQGKVMANFALDTLKFKTAVLMPDAAQDYSRGLAKNFKDAFEAGGGEIKAEITFQSGDKDFNAQLEKVININPDCIWLPAYGGEAALIIKQARAKGFQKPFLGGDGWDDPQFLKNATPHAIGCFFSTHAIADDPDPKVQTFTKKYKEKFNETPGAMSYLGYDLMFAVHDSIKRASGGGTKSFTRDDLKSALRAIKDLELVTGTITMGPDGNVVKRAVVAEIKEDGTASFKAAIDPE